MNYTIFEALQLISKNVPINLDMLISIEYTSENKYTFLLKFNDGTKYIVDLDEKTFIEF